MKTIRYDKREQNNWINYICKQIKLKRFNTIFSNLIINYIIIPPTDSCPAYALYISVNPDFFEETPLKRYFESTETMINYIQNNQLEIYTILLERMIDKYISLEDKLEERNK